ncbi:MAG: type III pantothenate kinase [Halothiobacillaceae bacterium]
MLAIDAGNTRVKWLFGRSAVPYGIVQAVEHRALDLRGLLRQAWAGQPRPLSVHVASVAGETVDEAIRAAVQDCWPGVPLAFLVSRAECCGVRVAYARPERFGVDRLAALVAAHVGSEGNPVVVVDAGTAVTLDVIDAWGRHLGGLIMPGLRLLRECLQGKTAAVGAVPDSIPVVAADGVLQADTESCVLVGGHFMFIGGVLHAINAALGKAGAHAVLYLTGGDAPILAKALGRGHVLRPDLVLEGVFLMAQAG